MTRSAYRIFLKYLKDLLYYQQRKIGLSVFITIFLSLTKGGSFIMLLPLLHLIGVSQDVSASSRAYELANYIWRALAIPLTLYTCLTSYVILILIYALLGYIKTLLDTRIVQEYKQSLRNTLFSSVIEAEWGYIKNTESTHIFNNLITEINNIGYATTLLVSTFSRVLILGIYTATSLYVSFKMTVIAAACFLPLMLVQRTLNRKAYKIGEDTYERHEGLFKAVLEFINSFKLAKSYNFQDRYKSEFQLITRQTVGDEYHFAKLTASTELLYEIGSAVMISLVLIWVITFSQLPAVDLVLMLYIGSKLFPNFSALVRNLQYLINTLPSHEGVAKLVEESKRHKEQTSSNFPSIETPSQAITFSGVYFGYDTDMPIFSDFNCEIKIGQTTAVVGVSGKGKTTLMDLILGLLKPQKGTIRIDTVDLNTINLTAWRNLTAYIPQECFLFHTTIRQNLLWAKSDASDSDLYDVLKLVAGDFVFTLPNGLDTVVGDQGVRLSGGERQRIALARAMLRRPELLILDEATNALDPHNESIIKTALENLKGKITILIISHSLTMHEGADQVILIE